MIAMVRLEVTIHGLNAATAESVAQDVYNLLLTKYDGNDLDVELDLSAGEPEPGAHHD